MVVLSSPTRRALLVVAVLTSGGLSASKRQLLAQVAAPDAGGHTGSLGQPPQWHWQLGVGAGPFYQGPNNLMLRAELGAYHARLNPVAGVVELGVETYAGSRGGHADGGGRVILQVPFFSTGVGADYNLLDGHTDMIVTAHTPVRRGGVLTRGSMLRINWYPTLSHSFTIGVTTPLRDHLAGRNRPIQDYVVVAGGFRSAASSRVRSDATLEPIFDSLRVSAEWIRRLTVPFLDQDGRDGRIALQRTSAYVGALNAHLASRSVAEEARYFHAQLERAFTVAAGSGAAGRQLAAQSRQIVLDEVILPYDRLLGRKKHHDTLDGLSVAARGRFGRWVAWSGVVPASRSDDVRLVFQRFTEIIEAIRRTAATEWDDPRLAWLPLQYALLPEEHDEQAELDALVERATRVPFTDQNQLTYIANLHFHRELLRMIHETRRFHVLWIHDFPAVTAGRLDEASFTQVVDGYISALAEHVEVYDSLATLPSYFILLDQLYYEARKSRLLMNLLENPLRASPQLPNGSSADNERLRRSLERLRAAVRNSRVLQAEVREYGDAWLRNRVKVHVNITNRADATFFSGGLISSVFGYPDNVMRDHRKIAFRDVSADDPLAGVAIFTGMGVGQSYLGPGWDDRSLIVHGPALSALTDAARDLLLSQGLSEKELPLPFQARPRPLPDPHPLIMLPDAIGQDARALVLVNGTGYLAKPLNVGKAVLYSLMPPGSVLKIPDSLWNSTFFGSLLVGASLRGAHVFVVAPARSNAPSGGLPQMARAHELLTRLLLVRGLLADAIGAAGGDLRVGLYSLSADDHGFASRTDTWTRQVAATPFLRELLPFASSCIPVVSQLSQRSYSKASGPQVSPVGPPKLHQKVQFLATGEFWRAIVSSPEWPRFMEAYLHYRAATYSLVEDGADNEVLSDSLEDIARRVLGTARVKGAASFAIVGSQNQDYRGIFMDGEVGVLFTGAQSLVPLIDLVFMFGTVTWIDDQRTLDRLLPPPGELGRRLGRITKDAV